MHIIGKTTDIFVAKKGGVDLVGIDLEKRRTEPRDRGEKENGIKARTTEGYTEERREWDNKSVEKMGCVEKKRLSKDRKRCKTRKKISRKSEKRGNVSTMLECILVFPFWWS